VPDNHEPRLDELDMLLVKLLVEIRGSIGPTALLQRARAAVFASTTYSKGSFMQIHVVTVVWATSGLLDPVGDGPACSSAQLSAISEANADPESMAIQTCLEEALQFLNSSVGSATLINLPKRP